MAANQILPFAQGGGANVLTQAAYGSDSQLTIGNQPGTARSGFVNKTLLQLSAVAAGVAQFLADNQGTDITDQIVPATFSTIIKAALNGTTAFTTQAPGTNTTQPATTAFVTTAVNSAVQVGAVQHFPATSAPSGFIKANGALVSRTTFAALWAYAQTSGNLAASDGVWLSGQFSPGDGSTTFRVPDYRGYHLRSFDDARGIDSGRAIGTVQNDALLSHNHTATVTDPGHGHTMDMWYGQGDGGGQITVSPYSNQDGVVNGSYYGAAPTTVNGSGISVAVAAAGAASENRVKNIAALACIKF